MTLYFLRHASARDRSDWRGRDSERPLTTEGVQKFRKAARGLKRLQLSFDWILTSPYRRAYDTAQIVAEAFNAKKKLKVIDALSSDGDPKRLVSQLAKNYSSHDSLVLVGHEPYLSRLVSVLIGARQPLWLDFKKGGMSRIDAEKLRYGRCGALKWWLTPKLLRKI